MHPYRALVAENEEPGMKRMRKGIVVLIVAASGTIGLVGTGAAVQAQDTPVPAVVQVKVKQVRAGDGPVLPQRGSSWQ
jgi:SH3-like domain-containing protein